MLQRICSTESVIFKQRFQLRPCASNTFFEICKFSFRFNSFQWKIKSLTRENLYLFFQKRKKKHFHTNLTYTKRQRTNIAFGIFIIFPKNICRRRLIIFVWDFYEKRKTMKNVYLYINSGFIYLFIQQTVCFF